MGMNKIAKVLSVGDVVFSAANGKPMKVIKIYSDGFDTDDDYYSFEEHGELYYLTRRGYFENQGQLARGDKKIRCKLIYVFDEEDI